jgi:hypothetical protein
VRSNGGRVWPPEGAYAAAFPAVAAAENVDDLETRDGQLADMILCPGR